MTTGEQLQDILNDVNKRYKARFISKTQRLLAQKVNQRHTFLQASLTFQDGSAIWRQDTPIINANLPPSDTNPLINPQIPIQSPTHAYDLFREYYSGCWFGKKDAYQRGITDLDRFCSE